MIMLTTEIAVSAIDADHEWRVLGHRFRVFTFRKDAADDRYRSFGWFSAPVYMGLFDHADY